MENNCLVTKLKSTVNDNSLLKVGEMFIDIIEQESPTNQTNRLYLNTGNIADLIIEVENGEANITLDENMASGWTNKITLVKNVFPSAPIFVRNGNYRVKVSSKYNLSEIGRWTTNILQNAISVDTKYLKYSTNMVTIISRLSGNLANLKGCTQLTKLIGAKSNFTGSLSDLAPLTALTVLRLDSPNVTGSLSGLAPLTALTVLSVVNSANFTGSLSDLAPLTALRQLGLSNSANVTGSLSDLAPLTALTQLSVTNSANVTGSLSDLAPLTALTQLSVIKTKIVGDIKDLRNPLTTMAVYNSQVTGELIEFVKTQRATGRTTGSCSNGGWWGSNITFNGVNPGAGAQTLTWTENTITNNGVTVNQ